MLSKKVSITEKIKKIQFDVSELSEGLYIVKIAGGDYGCYERLIISNLN